MVEKYAAAMIKFLNRENGEEKAMTFPITEIQLYDTYPDREPKVRYSFKVVDGKWVESEISS